MVYSLNSSVIKLHPVAELPLTVAKACCYLGIYAMVSMLGIYAWCNEIKNVSGKSAEVDKKGVKFIASKTSFGQTYIINS